MTRTAFALALLVAVSLAPAAPVPKEAKKAVCLFPHTVGTKWEYIREGDEKKVWVEEVAESEEKDGVVTFKVVVTKDTGTVSWRKYEWKDGACQLLATTYEEYSKPRSVLRDGMKAGDSWTQKCQYKSGAVTCVEAHSFAVGDTKEVTTPAGKFTAVPVTRTEATTGKFETVFWYADGVGLVRKTIEDPSEPALELKAFTPGKDKK